MIIVIEGVDGSGKTTLAQELSKRLRIPLYNNWYMSRDPQSIDPKLTSIELFTAAQVAHRMRGGMVFDRFHVSDAVYNDYFKRYTNGEMFQTVDDWISSVPHQGILLRKSDREPKSGLRGQNRLGSHDFMMFDQVAKSKMDWIHVPGNWGNETEVLEFVMKELVRRRIDKGTIFMNIAKEVSQRATCLSRRVGAVLVSQEGHVIATGYNGAPAGMPHPCKCERLGKPKSQGLDGCMDVHAEENCIAQAAMYGGNTRGAVMYSTLSPCSRCARMMINAGITKVYYEELYDLDVINKYWKLKFEEMK